MRCTQIRYLGTTFKHQWFQSQKYSDVFVATWGDQQNVSGKIVVQVNDPLFHFRATEKELRDYTDYVSSELHQLWHPGMGNP